MSERPYVPRRPAGPGDPTPGAPATRWLGSLSFRIAAWYGMVLGLCLVAYSLAVGLSFQGHVERELDWRLHEDIELAARTLVIDPQGQPRWPEGTLGKHIDEEEGGGHWLEVWSPEGERLLASGTGDPPALPPPGEDEREHEARTLDLPRGPVRTMTEWLEVAGGRLALRAVMSETPSRRQVRTVWLELLALSAGVLFLGGLGGAGLARWSLKPLSRMASRARRITARRLDERLPAQDSAELEQLRQAFNEALEQLERSFEQLRRFIADASHELRTPLTALRAVGEVGLHESTSTQEAHEVIGSMLEEVDRMSRLAEELLSLTRAEAGEARLHLEPVDLSQLAEDVVGHLCVLAEERQQSLEAEANGPVMARGDRVAVRQAVVNLVDNAIKYSPDCTFITLATGHRDGAAYIEVRDEGPGLAEEERARIFERFYRVDKSRSRQVGGTGLGLSLVRWTAEAHGGRVEVDSEVGQGSRFRLVLPEASNTRV